MIGSFFRVLFLAALGFAGSWSAFLFLPEMSVRTTRSDQTWYSLSFPRGSLTKEVSKDADLPALLGTVVPVSPEASRSARVLIARRLEVSRRLLPFWVVFLATSFLTGALLRERLHLGTAYASPTVSFLSKRSGEVALLVFFLWSFAPVPLPYWIFFPAMFVAMIATLGYVANLPLRL